MNYYIYYIGYSVIDLNVSVSNKHENKTYISEL